MMDQLKTFADDRLVVGCIYCGGRDETTEHVPSRVLLDEPLPNNLPVAFACRDCNNGYSKDEEYFACLLEAVISGSTDPDRLARSRIADIFRRAPALRARIEAARSEQNGQVQFSIEADRVRNVLVKLARGHAAYELSQVRGEEPSSIWWTPLDLLTEEARDAFNASHVVRLFGEVGSRGLQRVKVVTLTLQSPDGSQTACDVLLNDWVEVQEGRYRFLAIDEGTITVRMVIGEYLACEVTWDE